MDMKPKFREKQMILKKKQFDLLKNHFKLIISYT